MIVTRQEVQYRIKRIPPDLPDLFLCNLGKRQSGRTLKIDIVGEGEGSERGQW